MAFAGQGVFGSHAQTRKEIICGCGDPCKFGVSQSAKNPGREYYACNNSRRNDRNSGCGFFWFTDDEAWKRDKSLEQARKRGRGGGESNANGNTFAEKRARIDVTESTDFMALVARVGVLESIVAGLVNTVGAGAEEE